MNEMVERLADLVFDAIESDGNPHSVAEQILAAMREPTDAMIIAGEAVNEWEDWDSDGICSGGTVHPLKAWQAMIDEARGYPTPSGNK